MPAPSPQFRGSSGYRDTIRLLSSTPVSLNAGYKFSVVVRFQTPNYRYPITIEKPVSGYSGKATSGAGQSVHQQYRGRPGPILRLVSLNANACLKAYTVNTVMTVPIAAFTETPTTGITPLVVKFDDRSTGSSSCMVMELRGWEHIGNPESHTHV